MSQLEFEKPVLELESKIAELRNVESDSDVDIASEITRMQKKVDKLLNQTYQKLTPVQKVQVARHQDRPHFLDYIKGMIDDYMPLAGDRNFADDDALLGGLGRFNGQSVIIMGQERGSDTESRVKHNFGMARPEGYRKAQRVMDLANRFDLPLLSFVDTSGAYPGVGAEERGQSEAIARSIQSCLSLTVPFVSVIIGEGGSGGAIAIATANKIFMLEHAVYSVISPEGCASILWKDGGKMREAAEALRLTAQNLKELGVCDVVIPEPRGGAQRDKAAAIKSVGDALIKQLATFDGKKPDAIRKARRAKYLALGSKGLAA